MNMMPILLGLVLILAAVLIYLEVKKDLYAKRLLNLLELERIAFANKQGSDRQPLSTEVEEWIRSELSILQSQAPGTFTSRQKAILFLLFLFALGALSGMLGLNPLRIPITGY